MSDDSVNTAFELLIDSLNSESKALRECSAQNIHAGDLEKGEDQLHLAKSIQEFQTKIVDLRDEWQRGLKAGVKHSPKIKNIRRPPRRAPTGLVVKFPDGKVIKESTATETFARVIEELGVHNVGRLGKMANNWPLVSLEQCPNPIYTQQRIDNVLIMAPSSNRDKKKLLEDIARELNIDIDVSITLNA